MSEYGESHLEFEFRDLNRLRGGFSDKINK